MGLANLVILLVAAVVAAIAAAAVTSVRVRRRYRRRVAGMERRAARFESEVAVANARLAEQERERRQHASDLSTARDTVYRLENQLATARRDLAESDASREKAGVSLLAALADLDALRDERDTGSALTAAGTRELDLLRRQCDLLDAKLSAAQQAKATADAELTRVRLQAHTLEQQLSQSVAGARAERQRLEAMRTLISAQVRDLERQLAAERASRAASEVTDAAAAVATDTRDRRIGQLERELKEMQLAHQSELASLEAAVGAATARAERVEPLRAQLADREELLRSMAHERDRAADLASRREQELIERRRELEVLRATAEPAAARIAELEQRVGRPHREYEAALIRERQLNARIDSLSAELRDRDLRFRTLLEDRRAAVDAGRSVIAGLRAKVDQLEQAVEPAAGAAAPPGEGGDDLKRIVGIGPVIERMLHGQGITTLRQIAEWSDEDVAAAGSLLGAFHDRIRRDRWVEQARAALGWPAREVAG